MTSVGDGEVILRGKDSRRYIAMSSTGSLYTTVSMTDFLEEIVNLTNRRYLD